MQHRQVEAAAVPGNQLRRVFLDAVEKALDQLAFAVLRTAQRPHAEAVAFTQGAGDGADAVLMQGKKIAAVLLAPPVEGNLRDIRRRGVRRQTVEFFQSVGVGNGLDVED